MSFALTDVGLTSYTNNSAVVPPRRFCFPFINDHLDTNVARYSNHFLEFALQAFILVSLANEGTTF